MYHTSSNNNCNSKTFLYFSMLRLVFYSWLRNGYLYSNGDFVSSFFCAPIALSVSVHGMCVIIMSQKHVCSPVCLIHFSIVFVFIMSRYHVCSLLSVLSVTSLFVFVCCMRVFLSSLDEFHLCHCRYWYNNARDWVIANEWCGVVDGKSI